MFYDNKEDISSRNLNLERISPNIYAESDSECETKEVIPSQQSSTLKSPRKKRNKSRRSYFVTNGISSPTKSNKQHRSKTKPGTTLEEKKKQEIQNILEYIKTCKIMQNRTLKSKILTTFYVQELSESLRSTLNH